MLLLNVSSDNYNMSKFRVLQPPDGRFWADPHLLFHQDQFYAFFEDASVTSGHGHIAVMRIDRDGKCSEPSSIIKRPYHLSYPFVFKWQDDIYLIPESAENRSIELYRCTGFPLRWDFSHKLMDNVLAYDTTLVEHEGKWWMFVNIKQHEGASSFDELWLFYSDAPVSEDWTSHPMNPIVSDVRYARPAGKLFIEKGQMYRPSQDSSTRYGFRLNINQVTSMTTTTYSENVVKTVSPDWSISAKAVHTFNRIDHIVMMDAIYRSYRYR